MTDTTRDAALANLDTLALPHRVGHNCGARTAGGRWFNPNAGGRERCPALVLIEQTMEDVRHLHARVHEAAHDTATAEAVAEGMTGLVMADLQPEDRDGWTLTARRAIETLAARLDGTP